jgi:aconitase A
LEPNEEVAAAVRAAINRGRFDHGARRGNHEVMVRGTRANIRLRNQLAPGTEGGLTRRPFQTLRRQGGSYHW